MEQRDQTYPGDSPESELNSSQQQQKLPAQGGLCGFYLHLVARPKVRDASQGNNSLG